MELQQTRTKPVKDTSIYINRATRDHINMLKVRFSSVIGRTLTQDEALGVLFAAWDAQHDDSEAVEFVSGGPRE